MRIKRWPCVHALVYREASAMSSISWDDMDFDPRVEVFLEEQTLFLKPKDVTVATLSRVFKIKSDSLFLEEDITKNAEFPIDGKFQLPSANKYKVCGEPVSDEVTGRESASFSSPHTQMPGPSGTQRSWSLPRPWASDGRVSFHSSKGKRQETTTYEPFLKRSFPLVTLTVDRTGKSVVVDSTLNNVYVRIPESTVSVPCILSEIGKKTRIDPEELVILDNKMIPVSDDKVHTHSEDGCDIIKTIIGVSVGCAVVVMLIMLVIVTMVRSKKSHCHDRANNVTTVEDLQTNPNPAYEMVTF